jgi:hypothetical protein
VGVSYTTWCIMDGIYAYAKQRLSVIASFFYTVLTCHISLPSSVKCTESGLTVVRQVKADKTNSQQAPRV